MLLHLDALSATRLPGNQLIEQVEYVRTFLRRLAGRLETDGFTDDLFFATTVSVTDTIRDVGALVYRTGGSGSDG
ncbi:MAG: hypothetical protein ACRDP6_23810 [Actinoallomurus sp.]